MLARSAPSCTGLASDVLCVKPCSIPDGIQHARQEVGVVEKKWAQRSEMPLSEVGVVHIPQLQQR